MNVINDKKTNSLVTSILYIIIGIFLCIPQCRGTFLSVLLTLVGIVFIALGILSVLNKDYTVGVVELVIGIAVIVCGWTIVWLILVVIGVLLAVKGLMDLITAIKCKSPLLISYAAITLVLGIMLIVAQWALTDLLCIIIGVVLILNGVFGILGSIKEN